MILALALACTSASPPKSPTPVIKPPKARPAAEATPAPAPVVSTSGSLAVDPASVVPDADPHLSTAFVFLGDTGKGTDGQKHTADAVKAWCKERRCDFVAYLGDNLYPKGAQSADDPIFQEKFEKYWEGFDVPFMVALGNHDHYGVAQAEIEYAKKSKKWRMPAAWYTFTEGVADFYVVDSGGEEEGVVPSDQVEWLKGEVKKSSAPWKIAYGHHPIHSSGLHGDGPAMVRDFEPLLTELGVQFWLCGHDHDLEVLDDGTPPVEIVSGGGGDVRKVNPAQPTSKYLASSNGFGYLVLNPVNATLAMVAVDEAGASKVAYTQRWAKP